MIATEVTAEDLGQNLMATHPLARFATARDGTAVGLWIPRRETFVEIYMKAITGHWISLIEPDGSISTTLRNGKPLYAPEDWIELH